MAITTGRAKGNTVASGLVAHDKSLKDIRSNLSANVSNLQTQINTMNTGIAKGVETQNVAVSNQVTGPNGNGLYGYTGDTSYPVAALNQTTPGGANAAWYSDVASQLNAVIGVTNFIYAALVEAGILSS
jgi:hypothetical protein